MFCYYRNGSELQQEPLNTQTKGGKSPCLFRSIEELRWMWISPEQSSVSVSLARSVSLESTSMSLYLEVGVLCNLINQCDVVQCTVHTQLVIKAVHKPAPDSSQQDLVNTDTGINCAI